VDGDWGAILSRRIDAQKDWQNCMLVGRIEQLLQGTELRHLITQIGAILNI
jgi:hypothetical protein